MSYSDRLDRYCSFPAFPFREPRPVQVTRDLAFRALEIFVSALRAVAALRSVRSASLFVEQSVQAGLSAFYFPVCPFQPRWTGS